MEMNSESILQQFKAAEEAEKLNQSKPKARPERDRYSSLLRFTMAAQKDSFDYLNVYTSFITGNRHSSTRPIYTMQPIRLKEMMVPKVHHGRYLLCRTVSPVNVIVGTMVLIEDENGDTEEMSLYNLTRWADRHKGEILPVGTIMIIKEPYMKYGSLGKNVSIRVDSPSDVIFVDETDDALKSVGWMKSSNDTFESLKTKANEYFKNKDSKNAVRFYNIALRLDPKSAIIHLNRSAAYLQMNRFHDAYNDAKLSLDMDESNKEKALYRMGKAAYGMREWERAKEHFDDLLNQFPKSKGVNVELTNVNKRLVEAREGKFDLFDLYKQAYDKKVTSIDVADYTGPVEIDDVSGKGKGMIASQDIPKGTLLLVSKAFAFTASDKNARQTIMSPNMITKKVDMHTQAVNLMETIQNLKDNPQRADDFYKLYAGDLDRNEKIPTGVIDVGRIEQICSFNSFNGDPVNMTAMTISQMTKHDSTGLWILPSYINHACAYSAFRAFYGDVMVIHAIKDLKQGEEITVSYFDITLTYTERLEKMGNYKFVCNCELCLLDRSDVNYEKRYKMFNDEYSAIKSVMQVNTKEALTRANSLVTKLRKAYKNRDKYQLLLFLPMAIQAKLYEMCGEWKKAAGLFEEIMELVGEATVSQYSPTPLVKAAGCYRKSKQIDLARGCLNKAMELERIKLGIDKRLFKLIYSNVLKESNVYDLV